MEYAVKFDSVIADEWQQERSFGVAAGSFSVLLTSRQEEGSLMVRLMLGMEPPLSGEVTLLGEPLAGAPGKRLTALRREVAVVYPTGGLISNLKIWENLVLPLEYFSLHGADEIENRAMAALERVGYTGAITELPGHLPLYARKQVGLARALLLEPRLVVYDEILTGLNGDQQSNIIDIIGEFHRKAPGRTSLFLAANEDAVREVPCDSRIAVKENPAHGKG